MAPTIQELKERFPDVLGGAVGLHLIKLTGDASSRSYFRLTTQNRGDYVLQEDLSHEKKINSDSHPYISALLLFKKLIKKVPEYFGHFPERGWVLLEDLGDITLQQRNTEKNYLEAVDLICQLSIAHKSLTPEELRKYKGPHFNWAFDETKLSQEMQHTATHLIEFYYKENAKTFMELVQPTVNFLAERPRFFVHRDYHCRNLMVFCDGLWVIDFQDARMGPISYDIVSLLWDPYVPLEKNVREMLLNHWKNTLLKASSGSKASLEIQEALGDVKFAEELERMKIQRLLKAAGSYASFLNLKSNDSYLPSISPALEAVHQAIENLEVLGVMRGEDARLLTFLKTLKREESAIINC